MVHRCLCAVALAGVALCARGQLNDGPQPAFEVAAIKPADPSAPRTNIRSSPDSLTLENISLQYCIEQAFDVKDFSLSGPAWLDSPRFNIVARASTAVPRKQLNVMLQALLVDRFKLSFHRESKVLPAYALVIGSHGLKIKPVPAGPPSWAGGRAMLDGFKVSMADLAGFLAGLLDHPVEDMTGANGVFDVKLRWTPEARPGAPGGAGASPPADPSLPTSLFTALQEQTGLKLESRRLPVEILVVDHIERQPTAN